jgi:quercetin dioxygenase-like cupin family protein
VIKWTFHHQLTREELSRRPGVLLCQAARTEAEGLNGAMTDADEEPDGAEGDRSGETAPVTLDAEERRAVAAALSELLPAHEVSLWQHRLETLAQALPGRRPGAEVWQEVAAQFAAGSMFGGDADPQPRTRREPAAPRPPTARTVRADEGEWTRLADGIEVKLLFVDLKEQMRSCLLRCAPGTRFPAHNHARTEECLMLQGDLTLGAVTLRAGDYHVVLGGEPHGEAFTRDGCLMFLRGDLLARVA